MNYSLFMVVMALNVMGPESALISCPKPKPVYTYETLTLNGVPNVLVPLSVTRTVGETFCANEIKLIWQ
jgi:hypothetical protein